MSYAPFPSSDGNESYDPARSEGLRLKDAEKIAASRLETDGDGSLRQALADVSPERTPADEVERLADRIEEIQSGYNGAALESSTLPFPAEPMPVGAGDALDLTLLGLREWSDAQAAMAAELAELQAQPLFPPPDAPHAIGTHWQPVARDAEPHRPAEGTAAPAAAAKPEPVAEPPRPEPLPHPTAPMAGALDAAAKLAADANAAAAALESLTRMLQNHQRPAAVVPSPQHMAQRQPQVPRPEPAARQQRQAQAPKPAVAAPKPAVAAHGPVIRGVTPPGLKPAPPAPLRDSRQFDVRGFMAGFALSWAIGAVLYIYLMVG